MENYQARQDRVEVVVVTGGRRGLGNRAQHTVEGLELERAAATIGPLHLQASLLPLLARHGSGLWRL